MSKAEKSTGGSLVELVVIVAVALGLALGIQAFLVKPYKIPSESMVPTLTVGQRVLVNRIGNRFSEPEVGDVVVFHPPMGADADGPREQCPTRSGDDQLCPKPTAKRSDQNFIKRIVAGPGDMVAVIDGHAMVNGKRQADSFTRDCGGGNGCDFPTPIKVPPDHFFMMGDNRGESEDSRFWGPVPEDWVIGGAFATYWPPKRIGTL